MNYIHKKNFRSANNLFSQLSLCRYFSLTTRKAIIKAYRSNKINLRGCSQKNIRLKILLYNLYRRLMPIFTRENIMRLVKSHFIIIWRRSNYIIRSTRHEITVAIGFKTWGDALVFLINEAKVI